MNNQPYVKKYENGICVNPITKDNPYLQNPSNKDGKKMRLSSNGKGIELVVVKIGEMSFVKYFKVRQLIKFGKLKIKTKGKKAGQYCKNRLIVNSILK